ncbi:hypothetical protein ADT30_08775 [Xylella fastidiosa]|nr:hypothetical protein ADT30_08775 [Xylella fastidiosa]
MFVCLVYCRHYYFLGLAAMRSVIFLLFFIFCSSALAASKCSAPIDIPASGLFSDQAEAYGAAQSQLQYQLCVTDYTNTGRVKTGDREYIVVLDHPSSVMGGYSYKTSCSEKEDDVYTFSDTYYSNFNNGTRSCFLGWKPSVNTSSCEVVMHADPLTHRITAVHTGTVCDALNYKQDCLSHPGYVYKSGGSGAVSGVEGYGDCVPSKPLCSSNQKSVNGACVDKCPDGMLEDPVRHECEFDRKDCPLGQMRAPDGSCVKTSDACPSGQARGADGACKRDADGDGTPDDEQSSKDGKDGKSSFSWSGGCDVAPVCSGDPVLCGQVRIQWRIECNLRSDTKVTGGACDAVPVCTGKKCDAMEYSSLIFQWRTACAVERSATGVALGGNGDKDADVAAIKDALTGKDGVVNTGDEGNPSSAFSDGSASGGGDKDASTFDDQGRGYSRSCFEPLSVDVFGSELTIDLSPLCQFLQVGGRLVLLFAALSSFRIISGISRE